ncbi:hypothetical protein GUITHDRAFT_107822 [Guillardia theta CCMP2712]|uniref:Uncharacterized protein n=1 Tax=Guillardia theta (strain CCMP2712) TaxID=905079 RepID=L1JDL5_GUITC|nr:hypothetical protein GUITHDRAFT_107822 [Guillardia theta CCMP2712]EKX46204.1 hypothetical protein GUITHDRAFT_107822 [Guillardia theta CCMP2712]|eukprot:XP_005833184.1 hypothetical protein GUITHDRAFT_107822 [Guillardia theta CCMP2712]
MLKRTPRKRVPFGDVESEINATADETNIMKSAMLMRSPSPSPGGKGKRLLCSPGKNNYPSAKNPDLLLEVKDDTQWDDVSNEINACSPKDLSSIELSLGESRKTRSSRKTPSTKKAEQEDQENVVDSHPQPTKTPTRSRAKAAAAAPVDVPAPAPVAETAPAPPPSVSSKSDSPILASPGPVTRSRSRKSVTKPMEMKAEEKKEKATEENQVEERREESKEEVKLEEEVAAVTAGDLDVETTVSAPFPKMSERNLPVVMIGVLFFLAMSAAMFFFLNSSSSRVEL